MKPTANDTPKSSLSKSLKKSTKSRSKVSKSNSSQSAATPQINPQEPSTSATPESSKEKTCHRNYAGFGPKTIKIIWEQHDTTDTDITPDVYPRLAEDVTYKVWEMVNNIKTYARHCGGKVTFDLVNEVFKDSDVPPVLGASEAEWDRIDYDESLYFDTDSDKILELRDEYLKEIETREPIKSELSSSWVIDKRYSRHLFEFSACLGKAIFLGDSEAYKFGLESAAFAPLIGCCLRLLLRKCIEMLAFEQKFYIIEKCYKYLQALSFNPYSRDVECHQQLFHLSEILICHLLDTLTSIKNVTSIKMEVGEQQQQQTHKLNENIKEESFELVKNFLENSDQDIKKDVEALNQMDVDDIRSEYEALFQMMERDGFQERNVDDDDVDNLNSNHNNQNIIISNDCGNVNIVDDIKQTIIDNIDGIKQETVNNLNYADEDNMNQQQQKYISGNKTIPNYAINNSICNMINEQYELNDEKQNSINLEYSPYQANIINLNNVDLLCQTIGCMASQFGYFQNECTYLISKRLEKFFDIKSNVTEEKDYEYISRAVRALISLGETAFRELLSYLCKINIDNAPEWIHNDFSLAAVFLEGHDDIFLYEWLESLCGDKLQPFMLYSYRYYDQLTRKNYNLQRKQTYKITSKMFIKSLPNSKNCTNIKKVNTTTINDLFPNKIAMIKQPNKIGFKFAGCRPVNKTKAKIKINIEQKSLKNFHKNIIIGKRKLFKPLTNKKNFIHLSNYCFTQI